MSRFDFRSPLNFIMVPQDFEQLYTAIYHAQQLTYYATNFISDSVFSFEVSGQISDFELILRDSIKQSGKSATAYLDFSTTSKKRKQEAAMDMKRSFDEEIGRTEKLLETYEHLIASDTLDCSSKAMNDSYQQFSCNFRKYYATLIGLFMIIFVFGCIYKQKMNKNPIHDKRK